MHELVSIVSPCYNGEQHLGYFLDSILDQTYARIELILVDDGSTDNSVRIINDYRKKFEDRGFELIYVYKENGGQASAVNVGLKYVNGVYLMWMDSDDVLYPCAIEKKVDYLKKNPEYGFVLCKGEEVDVNDLSSPLRIIGREHGEGEDNFFSDLIFCYNVVFCPATMFVRMDALIQAIPSLHIYEGKEGQNWQLMLPLAYTAKWGYIDEVLFKYVVRRDSHSHIKKSYQRNMDRQEGFRRILCTTIWNIEVMPKHEKKYWQRQVNIKCWKAQLSYALEENDIISQIKLCCKLLSVLTKIDKQYNPIYYYYKKVLKKGYSI